MAIETFDDLFFSEVQELRSAEAQLALTLPGVCKNLQNETLARLVRGYATELHSRREDIERVLSAEGVDPREHSDQAMQALLHEVLKMSQIPAARVRDAAVIDSLQRIVHLKIAAYGSVATFAKVLDRPEDAAYLAEYLDREKSMDGELTTLANEAVNQQARAQKPQSAQTSTAPR
jgi:ferritin-like metal-binding protein YciE